VNLDPVLVHRIFGALVLAFALATWLRETGAWRARWADYLPPAALLLLGGLLFGDPWLFHGGDFGTEGHQHMQQGLLVVAAGVAEWFRVRRAAPHWLLALVMPAMLSGLGVGFLWHEQHAGADVLIQTVQHRIMGATLLVAALVKLLANLGYRDGQGSRGGWALVLVVFACELLLYAEPGSHAGH